MHEPDLDALSEPVAELLAEVARVELLARWSDAGSSARMKAPGEVVTAADEAAEAALRAGLGDLLPGAAFVGEESAHAEPALLAGLREKELAWVVDPLDGTRHFAAGEEPFGVMVALLRRGVCAASWIHMPLGSETAHAIRGHGAFLNGEQQHVRAPVDGRTPRGGLLTRFLPEPMRAIAASCDAFERTDGVHHCAARRYLDLLKGEEHFAAYWRTLPWDHAPGALLVREAGGIARRLDGSEFVGGDVDRSGLLVATDEATWHDVRSRALGMR